MRVYSQKGTQNVVKNAVRSENNMQEFLRGLERATSEYQDQDWKETRDCD